jgi:hypothetical protein
MWGLLAAGVGDPGFNSIQPSQAGGGFSYCKAAGDGTSKAFKFHDFFAPEATQEEVG